jgi:hypothetical protein
MRAKEFLKEFIQQPNDLGDLGDLVYLLHNAPVSDKAIAKVLSIIKQDNPVIKPKPVPPPTGNVPGQQKTPPAQAQPVDQEIGSNTGELNEASENSEDTIIQWAKTASPEQRSAVIYYIKLDVFHNLANSVIKKKIKVKADSIREPLNAAISSLAGKVPVEDMTEFLNECVAGGVIDVPSMVNPEAESVRAQPIPVSNPKYRSIVQRLLEINLGSASASGKGEFGLAFAGIDTTKGEKDINVGGQDVELKASHRGKDFFFKGQTGFDHRSQSEALGLLVKAVNSVGGNLKLSEKSGEGGVAQINLSTLTNKLNPYFSKLGQKAVQDLLVKIISKIHSHHDVSQFAGDIQNSVNADGTVDYSKLLAAASEVSFYYYQMMEKHAGILMLNISSMTYLYQTSPKSFALLVNSGVVTCTGAIDFRKSTMGSLTFKLN